MIKILNVSEKDCILKVEGSLGTILTELTMLISYTYSNLKKSNNDTSEQFKCVIKDVVNGEECWNIYKKVENEMK